MNLSRYILKYSTDDGTLYFNTKTNHSFFLTNELNRVVDSNDVIRKEFHAYLDKNKYLSEGEYEVEKYLSKISDTDAELLELTILTHGDCNFRWRLKWITNSMTKWMLNLEYLTIIVIVNNHDFK